MIDSVYFNRKNIYEPRHLMTCLLRCEQQKRRSASHPRMLSGGVLARSKKRTKDLTYLDGLSRDGARKLMIIIILSLI